MKLRYEVISHRGLVREQNEDMAYVGGQTVRDDTDAFEFDIPEGGMKFGAIVCDGLGGREQGEFASELACKEFETFIDSLSVGLSENDIILNIKRWAQAANEKIMSACNGMATTLTGLLFYYDQAYILNCGDSRTYRLRYDNFKQLSRDHSETTTVMYNCLGIPDSFIDITPTRVIEGDRYLICSDGLSDYVPEEKIVQDFASAQNLLGDALSAGAPDNVTIITLKFS